MYIIILYIIYIIIMMRTSLDDFGMAVYKLYIIMLYVLYNNYIYVYIGVFAYKMAKIQLKNTFCTCLDWV